MEPPDNTSAVASRRKAAARAAQRRLWILRGCGRLALGTIALLSGILVLREWRHSNLAMDGASDYARVLQARVGSGGRLPLNLEEDQPGSRPHTGYGFQCFSRNDARQLRKFDGPAILGYTGEIPLPFRTDGRAVVMFEDGECRAEWLTLSEFDQRFEQQRAEIAHLAAQQRLNPPKLP